MRPASGLIDIVNVRIYLLKDPLTSLPQLPLPFLLALFAFDFISVCLAFVLHF